MIVSPLPESQENHTTQQTATDKQQMIRQSHARQHTMLARRVFACSESCRCSELPSRKKRSRCIISRACASKLQSEPMNRVLPAKRKATTVLEPSKPDIMITMQTQCDHSTVRILKNQTQERTTRLHSRSSLRRLFFNHAKCAESVTRSACQVVNAASYSV